MRLWLRILGGVLVTFALTAAATYPLIKLHEYLEEKYFSGTLPEYLEIIFLMVAVITFVGILKFTTTKSVRELENIATQEKYRKKREKEGKRLKLRFIGGHTVFAALGGGLVYLEILFLQYVKEEYFSGTIPLFISMIFILFWLTILMAIYRFTAAKSAGEIMERGMQKKERKKREKERKKRESEIEDS